MKIIERREYGIPLVMRRNCDQRGSLLEFGRDETRQARQPDHSIMLSIRCPVCESQMVWLAPFIQRTSLQPIDA